MVVFVCHFNVNNILLLELPNNTNSNKMKKLILIATMLMVLASCEKSKDMINITNIDKTEVKWDNVSFIIDNKETPISPALFKDGYSINVEKDSFVILKVSANGGVEYTIPISIELTGSCIISYFFDNGWSFRIHYTE